MTVGQAELAVFGAIGLVLVAALMLAWREGHR